MKLVQVKMLTAGPNKNYRKGQVLTVDEQRAAAFIASKDAEEVKEQNANDICEQGHKGLQRVV